MIDERETRRLLAAIRDLALLGYPYEQDNPIDVRLLLALGQIAGIAIKALKEDKSEEINNGP